METLKHYYLLPRFRWKCKYASKKKETIEEIAPCPAASSDKEVEVILNIDLKNQKSRL